MRTEEEGGRHRRAEVGKTNRQDEASDREDKGERHIDDVGEHGEWQEHQHPQAARLRPEAGQVRQSEHPSAYHRPRRRAPIMLHFALSQILHTLHQRRANPC